LRRYTWEIRFKWARCFVIQHLTFGAFSTQRSESWHNAIKAYLAGRKRLLELCQQVSNKVHSMADKAEETVARLAERHLKDKFKQPALISPMQGQVTPFAVKKLLAEEEKSAPMIAVLDPAGDGTTYKVGSRGGVEREGCVIASIEECSMMCHTNSGLPCAHMFAVYAASNTHALLESTIHDFWLLKVQVAVEEGEVDVDVDVDEGAGANVGGGFRVGEEGGEEGAARSGNEAEETVMEKVPKSKRYANVLEFAKPLAALGEGSIHAYRAVTAAMDALCKDLFKKLSKPASTPGGATSGSGGVQNPRKVPVAGAPATKRKKSATEGKSKKKK
jgi:hypothetical protein